MASLQAELKLAKADQARLVEANKALENSLRAKDKEIQRLVQRETWATGVEARSKALENDVLEHKLEAKTLGQQVTQLQRLLRQRDADVSALQQRIEAGEHDVQQHSDRLAAVRSELAMSQASVAELQMEVSVLRNEAARVGAVAARVAANEVRAGTKVCVVEEMPASSGTVLVQDSGMVPVAEHLAEMTALTEELARLRDQVQHEAGLRAAADAACKALEQEVALQDEGVEETSVEQPAEPALRRSRRNQK